jgi:hypothetical protein
LIGTTAELQAARRYTTSVLLSLDINTEQTTVGAFLTMLDHFIEFPEHYQEVLNDWQSEH